MKWGASCAWNNATACFLASSATLHPTAQLHIPTDSLQPSFRRRFNMDEQEEEVKGLHFYRIMGFHYFPHKGLLLPKNFIKNAGCKLSGPAVLKDPSNKEWHVELKEHQSQVWFQNGWHEFMEYHSISALHLLVFRFDGNLQFSVYIFDNTAAEIRYPCDTNDLDVHANEIGLHTSVKQENQDEGSVDILDFHPSKKVVAECDDGETSKHNTRVSRGSPFSLSPIITTPSADYGSGKKRKTISNQPSSPTCTVKNKKAAKKGNSVTFKMGSHCNNPGIGTGVNSGLRKNNPAKLLSKSSRFTSFAERERAAIEASKFSSSYPFCKVTMKRTHVREKFAVSLPIAFARTHLKEDRTTVTLRVSDGRSWQIQYLDQIAQVRLSYGWKAFVLDNDLKEDDICIFELVDKKHWEFKVTIIRVQDPKSRNINSGLSKKSNCNGSCLLEKNGMDNEDTKKGRELSDSKKQKENEVNENFEFPSPVLKPGRYTSFSERRRAITEAGQFTSRYPYCRVIMRSSHVHGASNVNLPIAFARSHLKEDIQTVTLRDSGGKTWRVLYGSKKDQVRLKAGWKVFVLDNNLKEDDVCIFELVDNKNWELKVTIFPAHDPNLTKRVFGNRRLQNGDSGEERKVSDLKEQMGNEEVPFEVDRNDKSEFPNCREPITSKLFSESRKLAEKEVADIEARTSTSIYPCCSVIMKPSYVHGQFILRLPVSFTRAFLRKDIQSVTLGDSDGKMWQVRCSAQTEHLRLHNGWKEFALDNYLEEDDICLFELIDREHGELKVTIFKDQDPKQRKMISVQ